VGVARLAGGPTGTCGTGRRRLAGECVTPGELAMGAEGQRGRDDGTCEADPCYLIDCGTEARCVEGACVANPIDDASLGDMDAGTPRRDAGGRVVPTSGGCDCRVSDRPASPALVLALGALAGLVASRRRRKSA